MKPLKALNSIKSTNFLGIIFACYFNMATKKLTKLQKTQSSDLQDISNSQDFSFKKFLEQIRNKSKSEREKGKFFEKAIRDFLKQSPEHPFQDVYMWADWPDLKKHNFDRQDKGIDLVGIEKETGEVWGIQCKCWDENHRVSRSDLNSFYTYLGKKPFHKGLIVASTDNWGFNAQEVRKNRDKPCQVLNLNDLEQAHFKWSLNSIQKKQEQKTIRPHQQEALSKAKKYFVKHDRGKLIMACGTGKTFTSLKIAESLTKKDGFVLFLAPSISLITQTLREFAYERSESQRYLVVCSDSGAGDDEGENVSDLQIPPTTKPEKLAKRLKIKSKERTIVFSTYQSLDKLKKAQDLAKVKFDLVICDEAHRTTGADRGGKSSHFTKIHDKRYIKAHKRMYMTATPKIYGDAIKTKAKKQEVEVHSMDDKDKYGEEFYKLTLSKAIDQKLLSDYKVIVLSIEEEWIAKNIDTVLEGTDLSTQDASLMIGCYKALRDQGLKIRINEKIKSKSDEGQDEEQGVHLNRAVAFLRTVNDAKETAKHFQKVVECLDNYKNDGFTCETDYIEGRHSSIDRNKKLKWLKEEAGFTDKNEEICRILFNAKCLTEGIDVPSLDAVMFLHPRKSKVDIVQAVGRIIRKQENKDYGYVILPVVIPSGKDPLQALDDNKTYNVVWEALKALRSHDDRFNMIINDLDLNENKSRQIVSLYLGEGTEELQREFEEKSDSAIDTKLMEKIGELDEKIYSQIVDKVGDRIYKEKWIKEVEHSVKTIGTRIESFLKKDHSSKKIFDDYMNVLKNTINSDITKKEAISMLAEHSIVKPIFDKIFQDYKFSDFNPVSKSLNKVLSSLDEYGFEGELKHLREFYQDVTRRVEKVDNPKGRQKIIKELYEDFIKTAFPETAKKLGIVYTPIEIVDFMIRSVDELLQRMNNKNNEKFSLSSEGVHVIDGFSGTGTFTNRLLSLKDLIGADDLKRKYEKEIHVNEILLLPYYVSAVNIEEAYFSRIGKHKSFKGMCLTDTFIEDYRDKDFLSQENRNRTLASINEKRDCTVIIGNPPYSAYKNTSYPKLEQRVREAYTTLSSSTRCKAMDDSYVKAIRWASDKIKDKGIVAFIHNASLLKGQSTDGLRKALAKEFNQIYCLDLRGDQRTKGEKSKKEGGKIFGAGSRVPICVTFLVKNPKLANQKSQIFYYDIGDYKSREEKLSIVDNFGTLSNVTWKQITSNKYGDWINQRDDSFYDGIPLGSKKDKSKKTIFDLYSCGVLTGRDSWAYNFSKNQVLQNMSKMIKQKKGFFQKRKILFSSYRPFSKKHLYFDRIFNARVYLNPKIWIDSKGKRIENQVIATSGKGARTFSVLMTNHIPNYHYVDTAQTFPLYFFDKEGNLRDGISDWALNKFQSQYQDKSISKEDIFYYIYGLLHSKSYREKYKSNLTKELAHTHFVQDFWAFSKIGKKLSDLHLNYENQDQWQGVKILRLKDQKPISPLSQLDSKFLQVKKMRFNKIRINGKPKEDRSTIIFNDHLVVTGIPKEAYDYKINDWSAIKWIMEKYQLKTDKKTGIVDDPNTYSEDPFYILKLLISIITVSLKTNELVESLPEFISLNKEDDTSLVERREEKQKIKEEKTKKRKAKKSK